MINCILCCAGGDSDIFLFDKVKESWSNFTSMIQKEDCKIEISTVHCGLVENYMSSNTSSATTPTTATTNTIATTPPTTTTRGKGIVRW